MPKKRALLVDDSPYILRTLAALLTARDCEVVGQAGNGLEAVRLYRELSPDFVTLDLVMPQMGGMQTLQLLKRIDPAAKVIIVSSMTDQSKIVECIRLGALHYVLKPFDEEAVDAMLRKYIFTLP